MVDMKVVASPASVEAGVTVAVQGCAEGSGESPAHRAWPWDSLLRTTVIASSTTSKIKAFLPKWMRFQGDEMGSFMIL